MPTCEGIETRRDRRVIGEYTGGRYTEGWQADAEPVGPVQWFERG